MNATESFEDRKILRTFFKELCAATGGQLYNTSNVFFNCRWEYADTKAGYTRWHFISFPVDPKQWFHHYHRMKISGDLTMKEIEILHTLVMREAERLLSGDYANIDGDEIRKALAYMFTDKNGTYPTAYEGDLL